MMQYGWPGNLLYKRWQVDIGLSANPSYWAMRAHRYMYKYGTAELHIAKIADKNPKEQRLLTITIGYGSLADN